MPVPPPDGVVKLSAGFRTDLLRAEQLTEPAPLLQTTVVSRLSSGPVVPGYQVQELLGQGGMGVVYRAVQAGTNRPVALKMLRSGGEAWPGDLKSLRAEAEIVARFQHPHIVQIYEIGEHRGQPYLALEFLAGGSLDRRLACKPQPVSEAAALVETLAGAMAYAHAHGIIHRDLKPENVLLQRQPSTSDPDTTDKNKTFAASSSVVSGSSVDGCIPKITDFGLAKRLDEVSQTQSGTIKGTPSYMAPEQARGRVRDIGPAVDIYALGAILYEMLTGRPPFLGATVLDTLEQVCLRDPVPPSRLRPGVPRDLETICLKCLQKEPGQRYPSAEALAEDLRRFQSGEPILARPTPAWERLAKWARRKPYVAGFVLACLAAWLAAGTALLFYALYQAGEAELKAAEVRQLTAAKGVLEKSSQALGRAQQLRDGNQWTAADRELTRALAALVAFPQLQGDPVQQQLLDLQAVVRRELARQEKKQEAGHRAEQFQKAYDDALFWETLFTGRNQAESRDQALEAIQAALGIYDREGEPPFAGLRRDLPHLSAAEGTRLTVACYELLLIWAETEVAPLTGSPGSSAQVRQRAGKALALLNRAETLNRDLGRPSRLFRLRQARYLALSQGKSPKPVPVGAVAPGERQDWFLEGLEQYQACSWEQASQSLDEVLRSQESHFWARYYRALCQLRADNWFQAREDLTICLNRRPSLVWPLLLRGFASCELGFLSAQQAEQAATSERVSSSLVRSYQRTAAIEFAAARADFDRALAQPLNPDARYVALANRGSLLIRQKRWADAVSDLDRAVQLKPQAYQAYVTLARALQGQGRSDEALASLNRAVQLAPALPELYVSRAELYLKRQQPAQARRDFEQALSLEPRQSRSDQVVLTLRELGQLLHQEKQYQAALARFDQALKLNPDFVDLQRLRARTLLALQRNDEAGQALDRYLAASPDAPAEVWKERGLIHSGAGQYLEAVECFTAALRQNPRDPATRCYRGCAFLLADADGLALEDFEAVLKQDPANAEALVGRGTVRVRRNQLEAALADAGEAEKQAAGSVRDRGPGSERFLFNLACIYGQAFALLQEEANPAPGKVEKTEQLARWEEKTLQLLQQALEQVPAEQRQAFWQNQVQGDPALAAIRRQASFLRLAEKLALPCQPGR